MTTQTKPSKGFDPARDPTAMLIDHLWANFNERHAWLHQAGEQARKMNLESKDDPQ